MQSSVQNIKEGGSNLGCKKNKLIKIIEISNFENYKKSKIYCYLYSNHEYIWNRFHTRFYYFVFSAEFSPKKSLNFKHDEITSFTLCGSNTILRASVPE